MTDDEPLDLARVAADDVLLDGVRMRSVAADDSALSLLRDLLADVEREMPAERPVGVGSTVLRLASDSGPDPRWARSGTVVAILTAGVVAFGGVAAASTVVAPGNPLHGLGETVRSAAGAVVTAVAPPSSPRDAGHPTASLPEPASDRAAEVHATRPSASPAAPGRQVAAEAQSTAALRQVVALLDSVEQLLADGRAAAAAARLDVAERRLAELAGADAAGMSSRVAGLRSQVEAALAADAQPGKPAQAPRAEKPAKAPAEDAATAQAPGEKSADPAAPAARSAPDPARAPADSAADPPGTRSDPAARTSRPAELRQPSKLASTKPRA